MSCEWCGGSAYVADMLTQAIAYRCRACGARPPVRGEVEAS